MLGFTGTGKSTSIKGLNPEETVIFNSVQNKRLPFKDSSKLYNAQRKNYFNLETSRDVISYLENISEKAEYVKNIVIDDSIYIMRKEYFDRSKEKGYDKYTELAVHFQNIIRTCEQIRPDINVFMMLHPEPVVSDGIIQTYKLSTIGKLLDQQYNPMEVVPILLFSSVKFVDNKPEYGFYTNATIENGVKIPAKSPAGMFEDLWIPNDLGIVVEAINNYY